MAKIFKSFQVKIDPATKTSVPTVWPPRPPAPPPGEDEEEEYFQELPPDRLTSQGGTATSIPAGDAAAAQPQGDEPAPSADRPPIQPSQPAAGADEVGKLSAEALAARAGSAKSATSRRHLELTALEQRLRDWEQQLTQRESLLRQEEEALHRESLARRQALEQESARILEMAKKSAESTLSAAKTEAEALRKSAALEIETAKQKAYKEGYALGEEKGISAGEKAGRDEIRLDWQNLMQETEMLVSELQTSRLAMLKASEEEMVRLVIAFARRVCKVEPLAQPEVILANLDAAINKIADVDKIVLRINLKDKTMTESHKAELLRRLSTVTELRVVEDPGLQPGGVKIETGTGTIDATIDTQAQELENALMRHLKRQE